MNQLIRRLNKVEKTLLPKKPDFPCYVRTIAYQEGLDGEVVREETDEEAIQKHLAKHPEDAGREFQIMLIVFVSPDK